MLSSRNYINRCTMITTQREIKKNNFVLISLLMGLFIFGPPPVFQHGAPLVFIISFLKLIVTCRLWVSYLREANHSNVWVMITLYNGLYGPQCLPSQERLLYLTNSLTLLNSKDGQWVIWERHFVVFNTSQIDDTVKPVYNDHLMGYFSAFWSSSRWPRAT